MTLVEPVPARCGAASRRPSHRDVGPRGAGAGGKPQGRKARPAIGPVGLVRRSVIAPGMLAGFDGGADRKTPKRDRPDVGSTGQRGTTGGRCRGTKPHERRPTGLDLAASIHRGGNRSPGGAGGARRTRGARGGEMPRGRSRATRGGARQAGQDADRAPGEIRNRRRPVRVLVRELGGGPSQHGRASTTTRANFLTAANAPER